MFEKNIILLKLSANEFSFLKKIFEDYVTVKAPHNQQSESSQTSEKNDYQISEGTPLYCIEYANLIHQAYNDGKTIILQDSSSKPSQLCLLQKENPICTLSLEKGSSTPALLFQKLQDLQYDFSNCEELITVERKNNSAYFIQTFKKAGESENIISALDTPIESQEEKSLDNYLESPAFIETLPYKTQQEIYKKAKTFSLRVTNQDNLLALIELLSFNQEKLPKKYPLQEFLSAYNRFVSTSSEILEDYSSSESTITEIFNERLQSYNKILSLNKRFLIPSCGNILIEAFDLVRDAIFKKITQPDFELDNEKILLILDFKKLPEKTLAHVKSVNISINNDTFANMLNEAVNLPCDGKSIEEIRNQQEKLQWPTLLYLWHNTRSSPEKIDSDDEINLLNLMMVVRQKVETLKEKALNQTNQYIKAKKSIFPSSDGMTLSALSEEEFENNIRFLLDNARFFEKEKDIEKLESCYREELNFLKETSKKLQELFAEEVLDEKSLEDAISSRPIDDIPDNFETKLRSLSLLRQKYTSAQNDFFANTSAKDTRALLLQYEEINAIETEIVEALKNYLYPPCLTESIQTLCRRLENEREERTYKLMTLVFEDKKLTQPLLSSVLNIFFKAYDTQNASLSSQMKKKEEKFVNEIANFCMDILIKMQSFYSPSEVKHLIDQYIGRLIKKAPDSISQALPQLKVILETKIPNKVLVEELTSLSDLISQILLTNTISVELPQNEMSDDEKAPLVRNSSEERAFSYIKPLSYQQSQELIQHLEGLRDNDAIQIATINSLISNKLLPPYFKEICLQKWEEEHSETKKWYAPERWAVPKKWLSINKKVKLFFKDPNDLRLFHGDTDVFYKYCFKLLKKHEAIHAMQAIESVTDDLAKGKVVAPEKIKKTWDGIFLLLQQEKDKDKRNAFYRKRLEPAGLDTEFLKKIRGKILSDSPTAFSLKERNAIQQLFQLVKREILEIESSSPVKGSENFPDWYFSTGKSGGVNGPGPYGGVCLQSEKENDDNSITIKRALIKRETREKKPRHAKVIGEYVAGNVLNSLFETENFTIDKEHFAHVDLIRRKDSNEDNNPDDVYLPSIYIKNYKEDLWVFAYRHKYNQLYNKLYRSHPTDPNTPSATEKEIISYLDVSHGNDNLEKILLFLHHVENLSKDLPNKNQEIKKILQQDTRLHERIPSYCKDLKAKLNKALSAEDSTEELKKLATEVSALSQNPRKFFVEEIKLGHKTRRTTVFNRFNPRAQKARAATIDVIREKPGFLEAFAKQAVARMWISDFGIHNGNFGVTEDTSKAENDPDKYHFVSLDYGTAFDGLSPKMNALDTKAVPGFKNRFYKNHFRAYGKLKYTFEIGHAFENLATKLLDSQISNLVTRALENLHEKNMYGEKELKAFGKRLGMEKENWTVSSIVEEDNKKNVLRNDIYQFMCARLKSRRDSAKDDAFTIYKTFIEKDYPNNLDTEKERLAYAAKRAHALRFMADYLIKKNQPLKGLRKLADVTIINPDTKESVNFLEYVEASLAKKNRANKPKREDIEKFFSRTQPKKKDFAKKLFFASKKIDGEPAKNVIELPYDEPQYNYLETKKTVDWYKDRKEKRKNRINDCILSSLESFEANQRFALKDETNKNTEFTYTYTPASSSSDTPPSLTVSFTIDNNKVIAKTNVPSRNNQECQTQEQACIQAVFNKQIDDYLHECEKGKLKSQRDKDGFYVIRLSNKDPDTLTAILKHLEQHLEHKKSRHFYLRVKVCKNAMLSDSPPIQNDIANRINDNEAALKKKSRLALRPFGKPGDKN